MRERERERVSESDRVRVHYERERERERERVRQRERQREGETESKRHKDLEMRRNCTEVADITEPENALIHEETQSVHRLHATLHRHHQERQSTCCHDIHLPDTASQRMVTLKLLSARTPKVQ